MTYPMQIGDREYTKQQLLDYGRTHYPKLYWIPRGIGLAQVVIGVLVLLVSILGITSLNDLAEQYNTTVDTTKYQMYLVASIIDIIIGIVLICISCVKKTDDVYISHAIRRLSEEAARKNLQRELYSASLNQEAAPVPTKDEENEKRLHELDQYKRLLADGLITREVYDLKEKEYEEWKNKF